MTQKTRVLILGGGYVAISATRAIRRMHKSNDALEVTVVSRDNFHVFHGLVAEMLTGRIQPGQIISPGRRIFSPARLHVAEIEQIDLEARTVTTSRHLDGREHVLAFDHIVLALGSIDNLSIYPGLSEHTFPLKTYDQCFRLRNHILDMLELADIEPDEEERRRLLTFVVAGGGYAGVEVASDLIDYLHLVSKREYRNLSRDEMRVVLVHHGDHILPEMYAGKGAAGYGNGHPKLVEAATRHLERIGVEIITNTSVQAATAEEVLLSSGHSIPTRTIVSTVGTKLPPILDSLPVPRNEHGRIITDNTMQVHGFTNVWAAGDIAAVPHPQGGTCPAVGIYALSQGKVLGKNLVRTVRNRPLLPFRYKGLGQACAIGHRYAVGELKGLEFKGLLAWLIWRTILFTVVPTNDRRLRLLADWMIWPIVGRDIVEFRVGESHQVNHLLAEPGEVIVRQGDISRRIYIVQSGEVEVLQTTSHGTSVVTTLGAGHHFGNGNPMRSRRLDSSFRAKSTVSLMSIGYGSLKALAEVLPADGLLVDEA